MGVKFAVASPMQHKMNPQVINKAKWFGQPEILETQSPQEAVIGADIVYTDTWVSMGNEEEKEVRLKEFQDYRVTEELMRLAKPEALFMHDLPAYRGNEVTGGVIDGHQSVIFEQAENRLHAQKGLMLFLLGKL